MGFFSFGQIFIFVFELIVVFFSFTKGIKGKWEYSSLSIINIFGMTGLEMVGVILISPKSLIMYLSITNIILKTLFIAIWL